MDPIIDPSIEETVINSFDEYILCIYLIKINLLTYLKRKFIHRGKFDFDENPAPITKIMSKNFKHRFDILFSNKEIFLRT